MNEWDPDDGVEEDEDLTRPVEILVLLVVPECGGLRRWGNVPIAYKGRPSMSGGEGRRGRRRRVPMRVMVVTEKMRAEEKDQVE